MTDADRLLLQAALDGEIDAPSLAAFEQRLAREPELAREYEQLRALRDALRAMPAPRAPDMLRAAIAAATAAPAPARRAVRSDWRAVAATIAALGVGLAIGWSSAPREDVAREILADHLRGMISNRPVDVVSTDRHTVKPWFAGKITVAPVTPDLSAYGFTLEGGRIAIVAAEPAPTLVYRAGRHVISVTRAPQAVSAALAATVRRNIDGYALRVWSAGDATWIAVSDATDSELDSFAAAFRAASAAH